MRRRRQLSSRILISVVAILLASTLVGFALVTLSQRAELERDYQQRALAIAQDIRGDRRRSARRWPDPARPAGSLIQSLAEQVQSTRPAPPTSS